MTAYTYEPDAEHFDAGAYTVKGHPGIAWRVLGWRTEPIVIATCADCGGVWEEYDGGGGRERDAGDPDCMHESIDYDHDEIRTESVICRMVGDDRHWCFEQSDLQPLNRADFCGECGQIGCRHDGLDRDDDSEAE